MHIKIFDFDDIDRMEIKFGFEMAWLWWYKAPIRFTFNQIKYSLGIIKRRGVVIK
tara:strand:+ start:972 stop:1136 length:165 start_codon:yes stop_codon:yes gene_type:complete